VEAAIDPIREHAIPVLKPAEVSGSVRSRTLTRFCVSGLAAASILASYRPKHGSWLNIAEIELSALNGQCLDRRIPSPEAMRSEIAAWQADRNHRGAPVNWRFTTKDARIKLSRLHPKL